MLNFRFINKSLKYTNKKIKFIGYDIEEDMIKISKKILRSKEYQILKPLNKILPAILKSDLIISYYTIQFINPKKDKIFLITFTNP